jgi:hypothetical protein
MTFDEMRKVVAGLRRSHNPDTGGVVAVLAAVIDHLDPQPEPPPGPSQAEIKENT